MGDEPEPTFSSDKNKAVVVVWRMKHAPGHDRRLVETSLSLAPPDKVTGLIDHTTLYL